MNQSIAGLKTWSTHDPNQRASYPRVAHHRG